MEENRTETELTPKERSLKNLKKDAGPGRPPGQRNYATIYRDALIKLAMLNGKTPEELEDEIVSAGIMLARKGDYRYYKDALDRLHGTATIKNESIINVVNPILVKFDDGK